MMIALGAIAKNALQLMLPQAGRSGDSRIFNFPAWTKEWDVEFMLWAPNRTEVQASRPALLVLLRESMAI